MEEALTNQVPFWIEYSNVLIPLVVSGASAIATFMIYKEKVKNLEGEVDKFKTEMRDLRDKVITCEVTIRANEPYWRRESPVSLTDRGHALLVESGGREFVDENFEELAQAIEEKDSKTAYDVQENAKVVIDEMQDDDRFIPLKDYLYNEGIEIDNLIMVMALHLRDKVLRKRGWKVSDVDIDDPNSQSQTPQPSSD